MCIRDRYLSLSFGACLSKTSCKSPATDRVYAVLPALHQASAQIVFIVLFVSFVSRPQGCSNLHPLVVDNEFGPYRLSPVLIKQQRNVSRRPIVILSRCRGNGIPGLQSGCGAWYIYIQRQSVFRGNCICWSCEIF